MNYSKFSSICNSSWLSTDKFSDEERKKINTVDDICSLIGWMVDHLHFCKFRANNHRKGFIRNCYWISSSTSNCLCSRGVFFKMEEHCSHVDEHRDCFWCSCGLHIRIYISSTTLFPCFFFCFDNNCS